MKIYSFDKSENSISNISYLTACPQFNYFEFEAKIIAKANVRKNSFAELYLSKILKALFKDIKDLKQEYHEFYAKEYDSCEEYLYNKELLDIDEIDLLLSELPAENTIYRLDISMSSYNIDTLLQYDETILEKINQMLEGI